MPEVRREGGPLVSANAFLASFGCLEFVGLVLGGVLGALIIHHVRVWRRR